MKNKSKLFVPVLFGVLTLSNSFASDRKELEKLTAAVDRLQTTVNSLQQALEKANEQEWRCETFRCEDWHSSRSSMNFGGLALDAMQYIQEKNTSVRISSGRTLNEAYNRLCKEDEYPVEPVSIYSGYDVVHFVPALMGRICTRIK